MVVSDVNGNANYIITIEGDPVAQERHRSTISKNGKVRVFNPIKRKKLLHQKAIGEALRDLGFWNIPLYPRGTKLKAKCLFMLRRDNKDVDNLLKFILDVLQEIVYDNDKSVVKIEMEKRMGVDNPFSQISVEPDGV